MPCFLLLTEANFKTLLAVATTTSPKPKTKTNLNEGWPLPCKSFKSPVFHKNENDYHGNEHNDGTKRVTTHGASNRCNCNINWLMAEHDRPRARRR